MSYVIEVFFVIIGLCLEGVDHFVDVVELLIITV
jgi:hypothetical protein